MKGDLCRDLARILKRYGREQDYIDVSLDSNIRYNPLNNDLDPYAQAFNIASIITSIWGKGKEPYQSRSCRRSRVTPDVAAWFDRASAEGFCSFGDPSQAHGENDGGLRPDRPFTNRGNCQMKCSAKHWIPRIGSNLGHDSVSIPYSCGLAGCHLRRKVVAFAVSHETHKPTVEWFPAPSLISRAAEQLIQSPCS